MRIDFATRPVDFPFGFPVDFDELTEDQKEMIRREQNARRFWYMRVWSK